jgi:hypothetical protein
VDIIAFIFPGLARRLDLIIANQGTIMATLSEHAQALRDILAQNEKARTEILAKIQALEDALANVETTAEIDEAMAALKASVQTDDDMNADAPPPPPPPEE